MRPRILLVEDSPDSQNLVQAALASIAGITTVSSVQAALQMIHQQSFDLGLVDVMLEDGDGFGLTSMLRELPNGQNLPIIFMTAKSDIASKQTGFGLGAEDYIVKPYDPQELRLRVESRLKKIGQKKSEEAIVCGSVRLEVTARRLQLLDENKFIELTATQFKLLYFLMTHQGQVVSRDDLTKNVWGLEFYSGRSLDSHINSLRKKLGSCSSYIHAVYGSGYSFKGPSTPI